MGAWIDRLPAERRTEAAAQQFEALLVAHLLKTMREAARGDLDPEALSGGETYLEVAEQQLAQALAERGGLGLSRLILQGLQGAAGGPNKPAGQEADGKAPGRPIRKGEDAR
jgi:Rod binding domain-containing protein